MTDNEIIKALECHASKELETCVQCALFNVEDCAYKLAQNSLDLINRQKAENEKLRKNTHKYADKKRTEAIKEFAERLKRSSCVSGLEVNGRAIPESKVYYIHATDIDNIVKEMVGDLMPKKSNRQNYIDLITDAIIEYRIAHNSRNPECVVMSSALFKTIAGNNADENKSKFGVVKIKVYESKEMDFCLTGKIHAVKVKK